MTSERRLPVLDDQALVDLIGQDADAILDFQQQFLAQAQDTLTKMQSHKEDDRQLAILAHFLKTSALSVGALQCAELLLQLEQAGRRQQHRQCQQLLEAVTVAIDDVQHQLREKSQ